MMREWNSYSDDIMIDGNEVKEYTIRFKTTEYEVYKRIEKFFQRLIDESNCSEKPNNCVPNYCAPCNHKDTPFEELPCYQCEKYIAYEPKTEPQTDEEYINNLPWIEAGNGEQTDIEIARAIVHKAIDDTPIAEDAYPDLRQKMHDAVDNYEPQTDCAWKKGE